jgi:hypothetical protein
VTVTYAFDGIYYGLSTDTKPTAPAGYRFFETDLGDWHISDGTYWWLMGMPSGLSTRKIGYLSLGGNATNTGVGMFSNITAAATAGTQFQALSSTDGRSQLCISGTTSGNKGGYRNSSVMLFTRQQNPRIRFRFKINQSTDAAYYLGFCGSTVPELTGDTPLDNLSGVIFGVMPTTSTTNWSICRNDGDATSDMTNTGTAFDTTNIHTLSIVGDDAGSRFSWKLDSGSYNHLTTEIPAQTTQISFAFMCETRTNAAASFNLYTGFVQQDR